MSATDTPGSATGHPAKDSGGGTILVSPDWAWTVKSPDVWSDDDWRWWKQWVAFFAADDPLPIPPDDYARHYALEASAPTDAGDYSPLFDQCKPPLIGCGDRYSWWSQWNSARHLVPPIADYARHWELEGPHA